MVVVSQLYDVTVFHVFGAHAAECSTPKNKHVFSNAIRIKGFYALLMQLSRDLERDNGYVIINFDPLDQQTDQN